MCNAKKNVMMQWIPTFIEINMQGTSKLNLANQA